LRLNITPLADYQTTKLATIIASNDLPDILFIAPGTVVAGLPEFLQAKCADLTPYLAGDAVKDYPNLANFPSLAWQGGVIFNKAIYGLPAPYPLFLWVHWVHQEWLDQDNLQPPRTLDDYKTLLSTSPTRSRTVTDWPVKTMSVTASPMASGQRCTACPTTGAWTAVAS